MNVKDFIIDLRDFMADWRKLGGIKTKPRVMENYFGSGKRTDLRGVRDFNLYPPMSAIKDSSTSKSCFMD